MNDQDTVTIGGVTYKIKDYLAIKEGKESRTELEADFKSESRKYAIHIPQKARGKRKDNSSVISTKYFSMEDIMQPDRTVKRLILEKIFTEYPGINFSMSDFLNDKELIQYGVTRSNVQLVLQTLYEFMKSEHSTAELIDRIKENNYYVYSVSGDLVNLPPGFLTKIYDGMTQFQKEKRLKRAGVKLPSKKQKVAQPRKQTLSPVLTSQETVSVPKEINVNVKVTFEGFISLLFGIDKEPS